MLGRATEAHGRATSTADVQLVAAAECSDPDFSLVLDEKAIEYCSTCCAEVLAAVSNACRSVVACRARKDQKAQMLNLIKGSVPSACCLAIGDGANDVAMIKAGHVGVGIIGKEGMEAVNNSDFAIGQFRFLRSIILVHGRQNYKRFAIFTLYMFYENAALVFSNNFYTYNSMASAGNLYCFFFSDFFTVFFTSLPLIVFGFNDMDVPRRESGRAPHLYVPCTQRAYLKDSLFLRWMVEAVYLGLIVTFVPIASFGWMGVSMSTEHSAADRAALSFTSMCVVTLCVNLRLAVEVTSWTILELIAYVLTLLALILTCVMFSFWYPIPFPGLPQSEWSEFYYSMPIMYGQLPFWAAVILAMVLTLLPKFVLDGLRLRPPNPLKAAIALAMRTSSAAHTLKQRVTEKGKLKTSKMALPSRVSSSIKSSARKMRGRSSIDLVGSVKGAGLTTVTAASSGDIPFDASPSSPTKSPIGTGFAFSEHADTSLKMASTITPSRAHWHSAKVALAFARATEASRATARGSMSAGVAAGVPAPSASSKKSFHVESESAKV